MLSCSIFSYFLIFLDNLVNLFFVNLSFRCMLSKRLLVFGVNRFDKARELLFPKAFSRNARKLSMGRMYKVSFCNMVILRDYSCVGFWGICF